MDRKHCGSAIWMPEKVTAASHPEGFKPQLLKQGKQLLASEGSPSTSNYGSIASRTRSTTTSN
jgi:hypothetical protein